MEHDRFTGGAHSQGRFHRVAFTGLLSQGRSYGVAPNLRTRQAAGRVEGSEGRGVRCVMPTVRGSAMEKGVLKLRTSRDRALVPNSRRPPMRLRFNRLRDCNMHVLKTSDHKRGVKESATGGQHDLGTTAPQS